MSTRTLPETVEPLMVDATGVGTMLGLSARTVRRLNSAGALPRPLRCGGSVRWRVQDVRDWVAAGCPGREVGA